MGVVGQVRVEQPRRLPGATFVALFALAILKKAIKAMATADIAATDG